MRSVMPRLRDMGKEGFAFLYGAGITQPRSRLIIDIIVRVATNND